jgi:xanthine dehydrogenase accessory factor
MRGHTLGRVIYKGTALPNTNIPGRIGGFTGERVLRAPANGVFKGTRKIGDMVEAGDTVGCVGDKPMTCTIGGVLRGLLADGSITHKGMKAGDVDPRGQEAYCYTVSDKALSVGGGVLEAILHLYTDKGEFYG